MTLRCVDCARVRYEMGGDWDDHPGKIRGEVLVQCPTCLADRKKKARASTVKNLRAVERRKAKGFGPAPEGTDPFVGMREPRADKARG